MHAESALFLFYNSLFTVASVVVIVSTVSISDVWCVLISFDH